MINRKFILAAAGVLCLGLCLSFAGCRMEASGGGKSDIPENEEEAEEEEWMETEEGEDTPGAQVLPAISYRAPKVFYYEAAENMAAEFEVNVAVTVEDGAYPGWDLYGVGTNKVTAVPSATAGTRVKIRLNVSATGCRPGVTREVTVIPVSGVFARPANSQTYTMAYYDDNGVAGLIPAAEPEADWFYVMDDAGGKRLRNIFNAVYTPNSPDSSDTGGNGKTAIPYNDAVSAEALTLFNVTLGGTDAGDSIIIKGITLPSARGADQNRFIAIDLGLPSSDSENGGLPVFRIPPRGLGASDVEGGYSHIRLRVHRGARLVVEAARDPDGGTQPPACLPGLFKGGWVEVMGGGFLRVGAYDGFPLGEDTVIMSRLGSSIAVGPEAGDGGYDADLDETYGGLLLGPQSGGARVTWDAGDQNGDGAEIHRDKLAISANVTVKKSITLKHSVWLVNGPSVTVSVPGGGLSAGSPGYKIYGTASGSGGRNPASPAAKIIVSGGSFISRSLLTNGTDSGELITAENTITINNRGGNGSPLEFTALGRVNRLYLNWNIP